MHVVSIKVSLTHGSARDSPWLKIMGFVFLGLWGGEWAESLGGG